MAANISHPAFIQPDNENSVIWRYMDFAKYVALLASGGVYFSRADKLGDPYEGSITRSERRLIEEKARTAEVSGELPKDWQGRFFEVLMHSWRAAAKENYVLCWHMNRTESVAMWDLYSTNRGLAIQSTYKSLVESLPSKYKSAEYSGPYVGKVSYINYEKEKFDNKNMFYALLHKRESFKHESECRALIWKHGNYPGPDQIPLKVLEDNEPGFYVSVSLHRLVHRVVISPSASEWFEHVVRRTTIEYGYDFDVVRSDQELEPYL